MKYLEQFLAYSVGGISIAFLIGYLAKNILNQILSKDIEKYKMGLDRDLEQYKTELQIIAKQDEIRYSKLYIERSEVARKLYSMIYDFRLDIDAVLHFSKENSLGFDNYDTYMSEHMKNLFINWKAIEDSITDSTFLLDDSTNTIIINIYIMLNNIMLKLYQYSYDTVAFEIDWLDQAIDNIESSKDLFTELNKNLRNIAGINTSQ